MQLIFIGSGSAFTTCCHNFQSNMILADGEERLLIDCGSDARHALAELSLCYKDISSVYISHLHADHAGGLEWLGFTRKFDQTCEKPKLFIGEPLVQDLWNHVLSGGMGSLSDREAKLETYYNVITFPAGGTFTWHNIEFKTIPTLHVYSNKDLLPSYGLIFKINGKTIFITTDTRFAPERYLKYYNEADIIFHDCELTPNRSGVHAHYEDLATLPANIKKKMWLYHYNPLPLPDAVKDGFCGFVAKGQTFDL